MSYQAGTYEVCCDCGVLIPLHRLPEHPVICNQVNDETYPDFLDAVYELSTPDLIDLLNDWVASTRLERLTLVYVIVEQTWDDSGSHDSGIFGIYESKVLAEYRKPEDVSSRDYNKEYTIQEVELQNNESLIEKLKSDLAELENPVQEDPYQEYLNNPYEDCTCGEDCQ
jgi:hypothetical protein